MTPRPQPGPAPTLEGRVAELERRLFAIASAAAPVVPVAEAKEATQPPIDRTKPHHLGRDVMVFWDNASFRVSSPSGTVWLAPDVVNALARFAAGGTP